MAFFARPNLDDTQFKQLSGSTLTLEGQTQIATTSGFTLTDGSGTDIPVTASGASADFDVLTYCQGVISLKPSAASGSTNIYDCASPTTCTVGGLPSGTPISGDTINDILQCILVPLKDPSVVDLFNSLSISPTTTLYEIGSQPTICAISNFNRGLVDPLYCGTDINPAGLPSSHVFNAFGLTHVTATTTNLSTYCSFTPIIQTGNYVYSCVNYSSGATAVYSSDGSEFCPVEPAGFTSNQTKLITGVYPWYWDISTSIPISATCVVNGNKNVSPASGTLAVVFNSGPSDYLWFAVPDGTAAKTCWFVNGTNNGAISGLAGQTWACACDVTGVTSAQGCWGGQTYNVYVTCLPTGTDPGVPMCFY